MKGWGGGREHGQAKDKLGLGDLKGKVIVCGTETRLADQCQCPSDRTVTASGERSINRISMMFTTRILIPSSPMVVSIYRSSTLCFDLFDLFIVAKHLSLTLDTSSNGSILQ